MLPMSRAEDLRFSNAKGDQGEKCICPCCGKREGVPLRNMALAAPRDGMSQTTLHAPASKPGMPGYYGHLFNRQCLVCEYAWRQPVS